MGMFNWWLVRYYSWPYIWVRQVICFKFKNNSKCKKVFFDWNLKPSRDIDFLKPIMKIKSRFPIRLRSKIFFTESQIESKHQIPEEWLRKNPLISTKILGWLGIYFNSIVWCREYNPEALRMSIHGLKECWS